MQLGRTIAGIAQGFQRHGIRVAGDGQQSADRIDHALTQCHRVKLRDLDPVGSSTTLNVRMPLRGKDMYAVVARASVYVHLARVGIAHDETVIPRAKAQRQSFEAVESDSTREVSIPDALRLAHAEAGQPCRRQRAVLVTHRIRIADEQTVDLFGFIDEIVRRKRRHGIAVTNHWAPEIFVECQPYGVPFTDCVGDQAEPPQTVRSIVKQADGAPDQRFELRVGIGQRQDRLAEAIGPNGNVFAVLGENFSVSLWRVDLAAHQNRLHQPGERAVAPCAIDEERTTN